MHISLRTDVQDMVHALSLPAKAATLRQDCPRSSLSSMGSRRGSLGLVFTTQTTVSRRQELCLFSLPFIFPRATPQIQSAVL